jgi:hypothetical protein
MPKSMFGGCVRIVAWIDQERAPLPVSFRPSSFSKWSRAGTSDNRATSFKTGFDPLLRVAVGVQTRSFSGVNAVRKANVAKRVSVGLLLVSTARNREVSFASEKLDPTIVPTLLPKEGV